jgi:hypothetical protein
MMKQNFLKIKTSHFSICALVLVCNVLSGQSTSQIEYCPKLIKVENTVYMVKKAQRGNFVPNIFFTSIGNADYKWSGSYSGMLYPAYTWDIDAEFWVGEDNSKSGPQYEQHWREITFLKKAEWLDINEFDTVYNYVQNRLKHKDKLSKEERNFLRYQVYLPSTLKHSISRGFEAVSDFYVRRMLSYDPQPILYDWAMCADRTFLMPVLYEDTLHYYRFRDKTWLRDDYQGVEANRPNTKWTKELSVPTDKQIDGQFRFFLIQDESYFLCNSDTVLYKREGLRIRKIGTLKKEENKPLLYLLDKDEHKLYFVNAASLDVETKEQPRFAILKPDDPRYQAVQRLMVARDTPDKRRNGK